MDWNKSGRLDDWKFVKVSPTNLDKELGELGAFITGGTLTFNNNSDTKVSGVLNVTGVPASIFTDEYLIRIYFCPTMNEEREEIELGTFYFTTALTITKTGVISGSLNLKSTLCKYKEQNLRKKITLKPKSGNTKNRYNKYFRSVVKIAGGPASISGAKTKRFVKKKKVFKYQQTPMEVFKYIAKKCNGQITVNTHGKMILKGKTSVNSRVKNPAWTISSGALDDAIISSNITVGNSMKSVPNRVTCYAKYGKKTYKKTATLKKTNTHSKQKIGRYITKVIKVSNVKGKTLVQFKKNLAKRAKKELKTRNFERMSYEFETFFQPISLGDGVALEIPTIKEDKFAISTVSGIVQSYDINIGPGAKMRVKITNARY